MGQPLFDLYGTADCPGLGLASETATRRLRRSGHRPAGAASRSVLWEPGQPPGDKDPERIRRPLRNRRTPRRELSVEPREVLGKKVARLRRAGIIPANVFGHNLSSVAVQVPVIELQRTLKLSTVNEVIDLKVEGERAARPMIINKVQRDPLSNAILHADFYQVSLRERMRADVPIVLAGSSEAAGP